MNKRIGLGRGLGSLIPSKVDSTVLPPRSPVVNQTAILEIPTRQVRANPNQPRTHFDPDALDEMVASVKTFGIIQPLVVTQQGDSYEVIAGERRLRAAVMAGLATVPVIIRDAAEQEKLELGLIENIHRRDLNPMEEAVAYQRLLDEFNLTQDEVAKRLGKSRSTIANTVRLLSLAKEIQQAVSNGSLSFGTARIIAGLPDDQQLAFFKKVMASDLTVRAAEQQAKQVQSRRHGRTVVKDPALREQENELQAMLGTKVAIKKSGRGGQIVIDFYSSEELDDIVGKLVR
jgi:ParB family chromosome partitioning protein